MVSLSGPSNLADWSYFNVIILPFSFFCHLSRKSPDNVQKSESKFSRLGTLIKKFFLIHKEIQNGAVARSYITNGLLIYGEIFAHFLIF